MTRNTRKDYGGDKPAFCRRSVFAGLGLLLLNPQIAFGESRDRGLIRRSAAPMPRALPDRIINGNFEACNLRSLYCLNSKRMWTAVDPINGRYADTSGTFPRYYMKPIPGFSLAEWGWRSNQQTIGQYPWGVKGGVEVQCELHTNNIYCEITAEQAGTYIYQDIATTPGALYKWKLKHASLYFGHVDMLSVCIGTTGWQTAQPARRTSVNGAGDGLGFVGTAFGTKVSNWGDPSDGQNVTGCRDHRNQWETYEGAYLVPAGQTTTRFTFKAVASIAANLGNLVDDISFQKAYALRWDLNGGKGQVQQPTYDPSTGDSKGYYLPGVWVVFPTVHPKKDGCTFLGWSLTDTGDHITAEQVGNYKGKIIDSHQMGEAETTIHAVWVKNPVVHFMLNDEKGDAHELYKMSLGYGSELSTSDEAFGSAMEELGKLYEREVCEQADRWYEGDEYGATDWGEKFESKKVNGETWIWMQIVHYRVRCYSDGTDSDKIVFEEKHIPVGRKFTIPQEAYDAAKKADCNLDAHFGTQSASGFTGWFRDKALTEPAPATLTTDKPGVIPLYARNRATLRAAYANGSALPEDGADYRTAPSDDAPAYPRAMRLPSFDEEPAHRLDGVELPATGDWADQHCLGYRGEVLTLPGYATVYQRLGDGHWRTFRAQGWTDDPDGAAGAGGGVRKSRSLTALRLAASPSSARVQVEADATRYIRWVESTVDGVETSE